MLIKNWKTVVTRAYSVYAYVGIAIATAAPDMIYLIWERDTNPAVWSFLLYFFVIFGLVGRLVDQPPKNNLRRKLLVLLLLGVVFSFCGRAIADPAEYHTHGYEDTFQEEAFSLISKWEGKRNRAYQDIVGVWTICYGHTETAGPDKYYNDAKCYDLLVDEVEEYRAGIHECFSPRTIRYRLPVRRNVAYTSLAYNVGIRGVCKSTATRRINRGDIAGGCKAITWWNKAGGRVVRGLARRRAEEYSYCMEGLA